MKSSFPQFRINSEEIEKTALNTKLVQLIYFVLPINGCIAPQLFQTLLNEIVVENKVELSRVYIDDLLIFGKYKNDYKYVQTILE